MENRTDTFSLKDGQIVVIWTANVMAEQVLIRDIDDWLGLVRAKILRTYRDAADSANFIDPGCGAYFNTAPFQGVQCTRPYGHVGEHSGEGHVWHDTPAAPPPARCPSWYREKPGNVAVQCTFDEGHLGKCDHYGVVWTDDSPQCVRPKFQPIPAGSETAKTKAPNVEDSPWVKDFREAEKRAWVEPPLTDSELKKVVDGVMKSGERRTFLGVDVDLPETPSGWIGSPKYMESLKRYNAKVAEMAQEKAYEPPPAPCSRCSGSVINHAPGCDIGKQTAAERTSALEAMREDLRKKVEAIRANPTPPDETEEAFERAMEKDRHKAADQDEKPIEDEEPF